MLRHNDRPVSHRMPDHGVTEPALVPATQIPVSQVSRGPGKTAAVAVLQTLPGKRGKGYDPATNYIIGSHEVVADEQAVKQVMRKRSWCFRPGASYGQGPSGETTSQIEDTRVLTN